jgi:cyclophilin family peptidyl-prolyl cis-trans isomerase
VPTDKRARQKEGRAARQQALLEAQRRAGRRRRIMGFAVPVAVLVAAAILLSNRGGDEDSVDATKGTSTTTAESSAGTLPKSQCPPKEGAAQPTKTFAKAPGMCIDTSKTYTAEIKTNKGAFTVRLDAKKAPKTVNNFVFLARHQFYDGVTFHRVVPDFVIQGGDPEGTGRGGPGYKFGDELPKPGDYKEGSMAMANSGPNTNGSQFFVVTSAKGAQTLVEAVGGEAKYTLFGQVAAGMDVVKAIEALGDPNSQDGKPRETVTIDDVVITES